MCSLSVGTSWCLHLPSGEKRFETWALSAVVTRLFKLFPLVSILIGNVTQNCMDSNPCPVSHLWVMGPRCQTCSPLGSLLLEPTTFSSLMMFSTSSPQGSCVHDKTHSVLIVGMKVLCASITQLSCFSLCPLLFLTLRGTGSLEAILTISSCWDNSGLGFLPRQALRILRGGNCFEWHTQKV